PPPVALAPAPLPSRVIEEKSSVWPRLVIVAVFLALGAGAELASHFWSGDSTVYRGRGDVQKHETITRAMIAAAQEELAADDLPAAKQLYTECVEATDAPECHRGLASILMLMGDRGAGAHAKKAAP